jgi:hypothetical protein
VAQKIKIRYWVKGRVKPVTKEFYKPSNAKLFIERLQNEPTVRSVELTNMAGEKRVWAPDAKTRKFGWTEVVTA